MRPGEVWEVVPEERIFGVYITSPAGPPWDEAAIKVARERAADAVEKWMREHNE